ncbi:hypothetical protein [Nocardioides daejeonensis]|uniref:hypothetical protein n=1 Tax=Nocardioides daejeonensis TaxID=1046556 RepID=UPI0013A5A4E8|nr:hypothetical protein [Nocardioides daejeonensis]
MPLQATAAYSINRELREPGDPRYRYFETRNKLYLIAEAGAADTYGQTAPFTVRTVAFGSIPVVATLRLAQRRTAADLPVPFDVVTYDEGWPEPLKPAGWVTAHRYYDAQLQDEIDLVIETVRIDGVDLRLRPGCRTATHATLDLVGKGWFRGDPNDPVDEDDPGASGHYAAGSGGVITGTIDIPSFSSCRTPSGEDISPLLSSTVSGPGNEVVLTVGTPLCPLPPLGGYDARKHCDASNLPTTELTIPPQQF